MAGFVLGRRAFAAGCTALAIVAGTGPLAAQEALKLAFIPQENPEKLLGDIDQITDYLADEIGVPVEGYVTLDHAAAVEALRSGGADISFSGALPYVLAHEQVGAEVLLSEVYRGHSTYVARIFVHKGSGIAELADLEGKTVAFADPISESGYLYPLEMIADAGLMERGADPQSFFKRVYFAGGYQQAIQAVANGLVDAAGVSEFADLLLSPRQQSEVTWIAESEPIPAHAVIARKELDPDLKQRFIKAMLKLNEPENHWLLQHVYAPDGYVETGHDAYEPVAIIARRYGLLG
jgi:phosphonate transport system substrate-binding protein